MDCKTDGMASGGRLAAPSPVHRDPPLSIAVLFCTLRALTWCRVIPTNRFTKLWARNERGEGTRPRSRGVGIKRSWVVHSRRAQWARWAADRGGGAEGGSAKTDGAAGWVHTRVGGCTQAGRARGGGQHAGCPSRGQRLSDTAGEGRREGPKDSSQIKS